MHEGGAVPDLEGDTTVVALREVGDGGPHLGGTGLTHLVAHEDGRAVVLSFSLNGDEVVADGEDLGVSGDAQLPDLLGNFRIMRVLTSLVSWKRRTAKWTRLRIV